MFGASVKGIRGADAQVKTIKDVGEYDLWSKIIVNDQQAGELLAFSYQVGGIVSGSAGVNANKLDTNMRTTGQLVDESMAVYGIAIQVERATARRFTGAAAEYFVNHLDYMNIEMATLFRFMVGGEKPFAEGMVTWFAEAGGIGGSPASLAAAGAAPAGFEFLANNTPTYASLRKWEYKLPIGRIERFWGEFSWPGTPPTISVFPQNALSGTRGRVGIIVRLVGVRARGVS
jgi:hypothetical protein